VNRFLPVTVNRRIGKEATHARHGFGIFGIFPFKEQQALEQRILLVDLC
jgi:hypothetical protein